MQRPKIEDTRTCNAHFYLDTSGDEITRHQFVHELKEWAGLMLYVGGGYVPLAVAVLTCDDAKRRHVNEGVAEETFQEWARKTGRKAEIGEDDEWEAKCQADPENAPEPEYELMIERIPYPVEGYRFYDEHEDLIIYEGDTAFWILHKPTNEERCMGDGVDQDFYPGMVAAEYSMWMDAYFPDADELEERKPIYEMTKAEWDGLTEMQKAMYYNNTPHHPYHTNYHMMECLRAWYEGKDIPQEVQESYCWSDAEGRKYNPFKPEEHGIIKSTEGEGG